MEYIVVAFRSRAHTVKFADFLRRNGIMNEIINTPKEAGVGCGLSVKISKAQCGIVKKALLVASLSSFAEYFLVVNTSGKRIVRSI